jgi:alpha-L-fucosidase
VLLVDLLLAAGAAMLAAGAYRKRRVVAIAGCGCVAAAVLVFAYGRASAAVAATTVGPSELAHARRAYFERTIHRSLPRQLRLARELSPGWSRSETSAWFGRPRLGLFIHYGPTTLLAEPSDRRWWRAVDAGRFDAAARTFEPDPRVTKGWVDLAKTLGASYITVTAKHHDGFGLWDSRLTGWDVGPRADLLKPLARECRRRHVRLFFYYSLLDRHEPTYATDKDAYLVFVEGQLRELLTEYGPVAGVWFDGWDRSFGLARLERLYTLVHSLQPWALVATNRHLRPLPHEDFRIFENRFPRDRAEPSGLPREVAAKLGPTWFWGGDSAPTRLDRLPALLRRAATLRANLLTDVPPRPDGTFPPSVMAAAG